MPRFAQYDHAAMAPAPVTGWYDTDLLDYGDSLPAAADLFAVTDEQWDGRMAGLLAIDAGALVAYTPPPPVLSLEDQAAAALAARIAAGIAITCAAVPSLNATYALDAQTLNEIGSVARDAAAGLGLPGDAATFWYPDATGAPRTFDAAHVIALYKKMRNLMLALSTQAAVMAHGGTPAWPAQTATIP
jgi:hypothetical protein